MSTAHKQGQQNTADNPGQEQEVPSSSPATEEVGEPEPAVLEEEGQAEQIRQYLRQGYTIGQLTDNFGFKESTVRQELAKIIPPEGEKIAEKEDSRGDGLPVVRKMGGGAEVINPEAVLRSYTDGSAEDEIELRGMMKLRAAMLMVMDLVNIQKEAAEADAKRLKPVLDLMKETREEQDAAAARAKASNMDIAREAAHQTALEMANFIDQKIPKGEPPKDMSQMFTKRIDRMWEMMDYMMTQRMFPGYQAGKVPEGWEMKNMPPQSSPPPAPPAGQGIPGWTEKNAEGGKV